MRRVSTRGLMAIVVLFAVGLAILKNANELGLGMILLVGVVALSTKWPYRAHSRDVES